MDGSRKVDQDSLSSHEGIDRRSFLKRSAVVLGAVFTWHSGLGEALAKTTGILPSDRSPSATVGAADIARLLPTAFKDYPVPTYLPKGYVLSEIYTERPDGFGPDAKEVAFWFINSKHPMGLHNPLSIYVARLQRVAFLPSTYGRHGTPVVLNMASGDTAQAMYHDGFWVLSPDGARATARGQGSLVWETTNVHSLTFKIWDFTIGIRGSRLVDCNMAELVHIASSMA